MELMTISLSSPAQGSGADHFWAAIRYLKSGQEKTSPRIDKTVPTGSGCCFSEEEYVKM
jgi:hypothetical protein